MVTYTRCKEDSKSSWFKIGSPFEGKAITSLEYYKMLDQYYVEAGVTSHDEALENAKSYEDNYKGGYSNDLFAVIPSSGVVKAPFDGTIGEDSALDAFILCADNGVAIKIRFDYDDYDFDYLEVKVNKRDRVKKGDVLYRFDVTKLPNAFPLAVEIIDFCFSNSPFSSKFTILERSSVSHGDTIFDVEGGHPAAHEMVEATIAGYQAQIAIMNKNFNIGKVELDQAFADLGESIKQLDESPTREELNEEAGKINKFLKLLDTLLEYDDIYNEMLKSYERCLSNRDLDNAIKKVNAIIENFEMQLRVLSEYETSNRGDGFREKRTSIRKDLDDKIDTFYKAKQQLQKIATDTQRKNEFWDNVSSMLLDIGVSIVKDMIDKDGKGKK